MKRNTHPLHDENPPPSADTGHDAARRIGLLLRGTVVLAESRSKVAEAVHVREAVGENAREGGGHGAQEVEDGVALLKLKSRIPAREEVSAAGDYQRYRLANVLELMV